MHVKLHGLAYILVVSNLLIIASRQPQFLDAKRGFLLTAVNLYKEPIALDESFIVRIYSDGSTLVVLAMNYLD